jgi:hypothetical protein
VAAEVPHALLVDFVRAKHFCRTVKIFGDQFCPVIRYPAPGHKTANMS